MTHPRPRGYASSAEPVEELPRVTSGPAPGGARPSLLDGLPLLHARCGRPFGDHPMPPGVACPFPELPPVEFTAAPVVPFVRVCGIPDPGRLPRPVVEVLTALAETLRDHYGLGVEVEGEGEREAAQLAVETLRRYLG